MSDDTGNGEMWKQIVELHKKHSELQMQMHDKSGDGDSELASVLKELLPAIKELTQAMKGGDNGRRERAGARKPTGETAPEA